MLTCIDITFKMKKSPAERISRNQKGTLIACGLVAGSAIMDFKVKAMGIFNESTMLNLLQPQEFFGVMLEYKLTNPLIPLQEAPL